MVEITNNAIPLSYYRGGEGNNTAPVGGAAPAPVQGGIQSLAGTLPPVQSAQSPLDLAPATSVNGAKLDETLASFESAANMAASTAFVGDIARLLGRVMIEQATEQRQTALEGRLAAREAAKADLLSQADKMDKAADKMKSGALTSLITAVVGGIVSAGASVASVGASFKQIGGMKSALGDKSAFDLANSKFQTANTLGQAGNTAGDIASKGGASADTRAQADAKKMDAEGSRAAAEAQNHQQQADMKKEIQDGLNDMIKQIINFLKELKEAEIDAMRSLTRV